MFTIARFLWKKLEYVAEKYAIKQPIDNWKNSWKILFQLSALGDPEGNPSLAKYVIDKTPPLPPRVERSWVTTPISLKDTELRLKKIRNEKYKPYYKDHVYPLTSVRFVIKTGVNHKPRLGETFT
jgi:hypothetical protein